MLIIDGFVQEGIICKKMDVTVETMSNVVDKNDEEEWSQYAPSTLRFSSINHDSLLTAYKL